MSDQSKSVQVISQTAYRVASALAVTLLASAASAATYEKSFSNVSGAQGTSATKAFADSFNDVVGLIMGPGMGVVMAIGAVLAVIGWFQSNMKMIWIGGGGFVFAAILLGVWKVIG